MLSKTPHKLSELDRVVPWIQRLGMSDGTFLKLEYVYGFEKFNTRPYHNYETWAGGWRVTDTKHKISFEEEELEKAVAKWIELADKVEAGEDIPAWTKLRTETVID